MKSAFYCAKHMCMSFLLRVRLSRTVLFTANIGSLTYSDMAIDSFKHGPPIRHTLSSVEQQSSWACKNQGCQLLDRVANFCRPVDRSLRYNRPLAEGTGARTSRPGKYFKTLSLSNGRVFAGAVVQLFLRVSLTLFLLLLVPPRLPLNGTPHGDRGRAKTKYEAQCHDAECTPGNLWY